MPAVSALGPVLGRHLGDPPRQVDVSLGHPLDDVLVAVAVAVDRVEADQLEVEVAVTHRRPQVVAQVLDRVVDGGQERAPDPKSATT